ncbi:MAG: hypothetical protein ACK5DM_13215 [Planctomyces sp.]|jgi:hypothetical protein
MHPIAESQRQLVRREFFGRASTGVGVAALASLLGRDSAGASESGGALVRPACRVCRIWRRGRSE